MLSVSKLCERLYEARKIFLRRPGLRQRWQLYKVYRRIALNWPNDFRLRVADVASARDNDSIPRVPDAGKIVNGRLVMHNGICINADSYVGAEMTQLLRENRAVHEPQEEAAFGTVLQWLSESAAKSYTMIEVGSYWAFYSLWF